MKKKVLWFIIFVLLEKVIVVSSIYINKKSQEYIQGGQAEDMLNVNNLTYTVEENTINQNEEETSMSVIKVTDQNFEQEVLNSDMPVLVDFYADWCGPCKMLSPVVEEVAEENSNIKVVKVNVDESQKTAVKYQIMSIPTLVVIRNGNEVTRSVGIISKSEILNMVK